MKADTIERVVEYLPLLGPWRQGYRFDPCVLVGSPTHGYMPCTPGSAEALFVLMTGALPRGQRAD